MIREGVWHPPGPYPNKENIMTITITKAQISHDSLESNIILLCISQKTTERVKHSDSYSII